MRENRPSGSEGGEAETNRPSLPLSSTEEAHVVPNFVHFLRPLTNVAYPLSRFFTLKPGLLAPAGGAAGRELSEGPNPNDLMTISVASRNCRCGSRVVMAVTFKISLRGNWTGQWSM